MKVIHINASEKQKSRLRNGHPVRCSPCAEGAGVQLLIHPERFDKVARVFRQGKGTTIALDGAEMEANREVEGSGIFGKKFDRFVKKTIGKKNTKALYSGLEKVAKPIVNTAIDTAGAAATAYAPSAAPAIEAAKRAAKGYIARPTAYQKDPAKELRKDVNPEGMARDYAQGKVDAYMKGEGIFDMVKKAAKSKMGKSLIKKGVSMAAKEAVKRGAPSELVNPLASMGTKALTGGRIMGGRMYMERSMVGKGSVSAFMPPAMVSQPYSANFAMNTQLPPDMVRGGVSFGGGLGAGSYRGQGLYL
jgi:hypothetical protein